VFGRTEERIARIQETYIGQANSSWLESLERSLTQMKDYQVNEFCERDALLNMEANGN